MDWIDRTFIDLQIDRQTDWIHKQIMDTEIDTWLDKQLIESQIDRWIHRQFMYREIDELRDRPRIDIDRWINRYKIVIYTFISIDQLIRIKADFHQYFQWLLIDQHLRGHFRIVFCFKH